MPFLTFTFLLTANKTIVKRQDLRLKNSLLGNHITASNFLIQRRIRIQENKKWT
jgi:hypothetical protein